MNVSSRLRVETGDNALFAGFIITGNASKKVLLRAIGPSLKSGSDDVPGRMDDPTIELFDNDGKSIEFNNNWKDSSEREDIESSGFNPPDDRESVISRVLQPGVYSAIVRGAGDSTGIALVEVFDRTAGASSQLANISSRGFVRTGDNALFAGFILSNEQAGTRVLARGIGPSLKPGVASALDDTTIEFRNANGDPLAENDNWKDSADRAEIEATGLQPTNDAEAAVIVTIPTADYTAIVRGKDGTTGIGVVEVYNVPRPASSAGD